ncbi:hypothetical protein DFH06DRAFT_1126869 [Mycena polygramma]|nr:hypothetical protein DFH06DRAFT_1126869 [Mycena polygramma]
MSNGVFEVEISLTDKPVSTKIEKENAPPIAIVPTVSPATPKGLKRARLDSDAVKNEDCAPAPKELSRGAALRIAQLESEVHLLRAQLHANQEAMDRFVEGLQREWEDVRSACLSSRNSVGGLGIRLRRVEGHIDEIVEHLPAHYGWKSEIGSDLEVEDGSQPVEEPWWFQGFDPDVKEEEPEEV